MSVVHNLKNFTPTKGMLAWVAAGASVLTMAVGFTVGGWVTGGSADRMAQEARNDAQAELVASVCAANFRTLPTAQAAHEELVALSNLRQRQFVLDQPWAQVPGVATVSRAAATRCAQMISEMDPAEFGAPVQAAT